MTSDRIRQIQETTSCPNSVSVQQALLQVWNECQQENKEEIERLKGGKGKFYVVAKSSEENWEQITQGLDTYDQAKHYKDSAFCKDKWKNSFIVQQIN